jgi:CBS domain-containing protein
MRLAQRHRLHHLLVVERYRLVGVIATRDLRGGGWIADRMTRDIWAVLGDATLGEALAAMVALRVSMLPVIGERFVIGVVTRSDLERLGVAANLFEASSPSP